MAKKVNYDGFEFELDGIPWNKPVTGAKIKEKVSEKTGQKPEGAPYIARGGELTHVAADETVTLENGDRIGFTPTFETAHEEIKA